MLMVFVLRGFRLGLISTVRLDDRKDVLASLVNIAFTAENSHSYI